MVRCIQELLDGRGGNYILPFFWQHGEDEEVLRRYVKVIGDSGCGAFCVESRPHPDFCGPRWWRDMDVILAEAKTRGMKVWILDDAHFPTGYANGVLQGADPALCKQYLFYSRNDVCGPLPQATLNVASAARYRNDQPPEPFFHKGYTPRVFDDDAMLAVVAGRVGRDNRMEELVELTHLVEDGSLCWDVPAGMWKVFVLYLTRNGGGRSDYINVLDRRSCRVQIDAVYEPHFARYGDEFGKTIAGFFSDEPLFGNTVGFRMDESIGRKVMPLPWSADVPALLEERLGAEWKTALPLLWEPAADDGHSARARHAYMDVVTALVEKNFSYQLGDWCRERGVEYIGHVIEDNDQHARLGCTLGHFFRSLAGQDMAGIDDIGGQVLPGGEDIVRPALFGAPGDGEFYHFVLGKLASSHAHIDPKKKGRAMCEIFGAYGWNLGVRDMKYLADHFLVRGVNHYVPHAFSPRAYPDPDCPPHFYAHGRNPQYRHFSALIPYMNRVCHLLNQSTHTAPVALLYHAEAEWAGEYMPDKLPARALHEHQIDFDILPTDVFARPQDYDATIDGVLRVCQEEFGALVIPSCQFLTEAVAVFAAKATAKGFPVIFVNTLPQGISDVLVPQRETELLAGLSGCVVTTLAELPGQVRSRIPCDLQATPNFRRLRYYHCRSEGQELYLLLNEDPGEAFCGTVAVPVRGVATAYDAFDNKTQAVRCRGTGAGMEFALTLAPLEMAILVIDPRQEPPVAFAPEPVEQRSPLAAQWKISIAQSLEYPHFHDEWEANTLDSIAQRHPDFSGFIRYETEVTLTEEEAKADLLELEDAYEGAELWVNDTYAGMRITRPYRFGVKNLLRPGANRVRIEVATTLLRENRRTVEEAAFGNRASRVFAPTGIVGEVAVVRVR